MWHVEGTCRRTIVRNPRRRRTRPGVLATVVARHTPTGTPGYPPWHRTSTPGSTRSPAPTPAASTRDVVVEEASGRREDGPELARVRAQLREGDTFVVTKLERLGRSGAYVASLVRGLDDRGVTLGVDRDDRYLERCRATHGSRAGRRCANGTDLTRERTLDGLAAARACDRVGSRPTVVTADRVAAARPSPVGGRAPPSPARSASFRTVCTDT
ncbi:recombinase family protein [Cellulosimicrobium sp. RS]|uniref:recombinase family protein n=1 Tax=Cellulosimicrobium sp. RS TaxID=3381347 RepID=UPI0038FC10D5